MQRCRWYKVSITRNCLPNMLIVQRSASHPSPTRSPLRQALLQKVLKRTVWALINDHLTHLRSRDHIKLQSRLNKSKQFYKKVKWMKPPLKRKQETQEWASRPGAPSWAASRARAAAPAPTNRAARPPAGPLLIGPNEKRSGAPRIGFFRPPRERLV